MVDTLLDIIDADGPDPGTLVAPDEIILGEGMRDVMLLVESVAPTDAPVLILGETGVGKEVTARAVHDHSSRARGPIVKVNCGAISPELIDSELFGHERGSFTGAVASRKGWFERAHCGTLFLDEIGELPLAAQVRLLRVLQDGSFERVGGQQPRRTDVRVVTATHRDLSELVATGHFRRDLWYRISVFPLRIPPLRERPDDVAQLASHFAARATARMGGAPLLPTADEIALLTAYDWPGNVRELAAVVERAAILGQGRTLAIAAAMPAIVRGGLSQDGGRAPPSRSRPHFPGTVRPLDAVIVEHIERALLATSGRIEGPNGAADLLNVNPHTLRARMRKFGIDWARFRVSEDKG